MTSDIIRILVPNFRKWQRDTDRKRMFLFLDRNFFSDPKIQFLQSQCQEATHVYLWILMNLDDPHTCRLDIRLPFLKIALKQVLGKQSNNLNPMKYLNLLTTCGLIELKFLPEEAQPDAHKPATRSQPSGNMARTPRVKPPQIQALTDALHEDQDKKGSEQDKKGEEEGSVEAAEIPPPPTTNQALDGVTWFSVRRPGVNYPGGRYSEKEWLRMELIRRLRSARKSIRPDTDLDTLMLTYDSYSYELVTHWLNYPLEKRLAAYVYAVIQKKKPDPLDYAFQALKNGWEGMERNVRQSKAILSQSLEVEFDE